MLFEPPIRWFESVGSMAMSVSDCGPASLETLTLVPTVAGPWARARGGAAAVSRASKPRFRACALPTSVFASGVKRRPNAGRVSGVPKVLTWVRGRRRCAVTCAGWFVSAVWGAAAGAAVGVAAGVLVSETLFIVFSQRLRGVVQRDSAGLSGVERR